MQQLKADLSKMTLERGLHSVPLSLPDSNSKKTGLRAATEGLRPAEVAPYQHYLIASFTSEPRLLLAGRISI